MGIIVDYDTLVQAIRDEAEDDGAEFLAFIPTAIALAEERLFRELDLPQLEEKDTGTLSPNVRQLVKPTGYQFMDYFAVIKDNVRCVLKKKTESFLADYWPNALNTATPKYYCDENATLFVVAPTPPAGVTYEMKYTKKPEKLSSSNSTNYFVEQLPDILFVACMIEMLRFMKATSQANAWQESYTRLQDGVNALAMRYRRDGSTTPQNIANGPNSLRHTLNSKA